MGKPVAILIGVVAVATVGLVLVNWREVASPVTPKAPVPLSQTVPAMDAPSDAVAPPAVPTEVPPVPPAPIPTASAADPAVAPPANLPPPTPSEPSSAPEPERPVVGESPYPAGGKPVGPFDIAWSFQVGVTRARGSITVRHLSSAARVVVEVVARDGARLAQPFRTEMELDQDGTQTFPLEVFLGEGTNTLVVTATAHAIDRRARVVAIPLVPAAAAPVSPAPAVPAAPVPPGSGDASGKPAAPLSGSQVIRDDHGEVIQFEPAAPAGK